MDSLDLMLKKSHIDSFGYSEIQTKLDKYGITYMFKGNLDPARYVLLKFISAFLCFVAGLQINLLSCLPLTVIGWFFWDWLFQYSDKLDNENMLDDIQRFFSLLRVQTLSGRPLANAIEDGFMVVKNPRLKDGLQKLSSDILSRRNLSDAIDDFDSKFTNQYLKNFSILVYQSQDTGQSQKGFEDLAKQISMIYDSIYTKKKNRFERKTAFINIGIFAAIISLMIFYIFSQIDFGSLF